MCLRSCTIARGICKVLAMRAYKNGRPGVAFSWCIRGKVSPVFKEFSRLSVISFMSLSLSIFFSLPPPSGLCICWIFSRKVSCSCVLVLWCSLSCNITCFVYYRYFENYKNEGEFLDLDLLDHLGDTILMNERLMFLGE